MQEECKRVMYPVSQRTEIQDGCPLSLHPLHLQLQPATEKDPVTVCVHCPRKHPVKQCPVHLKGFYFILNRRASIVICVCCVYVSF